MCALFAAGASFLGGVSHHNREKSGTIQQHVREIFSKILNLGGVYVFGLHKNKAMEKSPGVFLSWRGNCEGDPLSPPVGDAAQGGKPP